MDWATPLSILKLVLLLRWWSKGPVTGCGSATWLSKVEGRKCDFVKRRNRIHRWCVGVLPDELHAKGQRASALDPRCGSG